MQENVSFQNQHSPVNSEFLPKIVVVGGLSTHQGDGPTHNLQHLREDENIIATAPSSTEQPQSEPSLFEDITNDLGLPPPKQLKASFWEVFS